MTQPSQSSPPYSADQSAPGAASPPFLAEGRLMRFSALPASLHQDSSPDAAGVSPDASCAFLHVQTHLVTPSVPGQTLQSQVGYL